jgi:hypothetical protein
MYLLDLKGYEVMETSEFLPEVLEHLTQLVKEQCHDIRRGDLVTIFPNEERYRNDGTGIWDGERLRNLSGNPDDYGTIPEEFMVDEENFAPDWWVNVIAHNNLWWPSGQIRDECIAHVEYGKLEGVDQECWHTHFTWKGEKMPVVMDREEKVTQKFFVRALNQECFEYTGKDMDFSSFTGAEDFICCTVSGSQLEWIEAMEAQMEEEEQEELDAATERERMERRLRWTNA